MTLPEGVFDLDAMWRAVGSPEEKAPITWMKGSRRALVKQLLALGSIIISDDLAVQRELQKIEDELRAEHIIA
jgi:hypothetical protein